MKALQKIEPAFGLQFRDVAPPSAPGPGEVIVAVGATGVCGTDVHIYEWTGGYEVMRGAMPVTIGHEFAGTVAAIGEGVRGLAIGAPVAVRPSVVCGQCVACRAGNPDHCTQRRGIGVTRDGGLAPLVRVPAENAVRVPPEMPIEIAALTEPMTVSAEAVANGDVKPGSRVLILGPGNIGQGAALFARAAGAAEIVIVGRNDEARLERLRRMGFTNTLDIAETSFETALAPFLAKGKFDVVIEATGAPAVVQQGLDVLAKRGILVVVGIHPKPVSVDLLRLVREHQQIRGSYRAPIATWQRVVDFLAANADAGARDDQPSPAARRGHRGARAFAQQGCVEGAHRAGRTRRRTKVTR